MAYQASLVLKNLAKRIEKYTEFKGDNLDFLVDEIPLRIIRRTLQGNDENNKPLKPLSDTYVIARRGFKVGEAWFYARSQLSIKQSLRHIKGTLSKNKVIVPNKKGNTSEIKLIKFKAKGLPVLGADASPTKSNLTLTGQMLSSIIGNRDGSKFTFIFSNPESDKKAYYARTTGRPFFNLSPTDKKGLLTKISAIIRKNLREMKGNA